MLSSQRRLLQLTTKNNVAVLTTMRHNSSSVGNKVQLNNVTTATTTNTTTTTTPVATGTVDKETQLANKQTERVKIPFMPVINIPETEFAHHSFFSLYRPLLGLSDENETPFFSKKQEKSAEERHQEKMDTMLAVYMSHCVPFVEPSQGQSTEDWKNDFIEAYDNAEKVKGVATTTTEDYNEFQDLFNEEAQIEEEVLIDSYNKPSLPMFHMPESGDVLDYLTSIESNMKEEHLKLDEQDRLKEKRLKKLDILNNNSQKPRFYSTPNRNNIQQKLRRYQIKWMLK